MLNEKYIYEMWMLETINKCENYIAVNCMRIKSIKFGVNKL